VVSLRQDKDLDRIVTGHRGRSARRLYGSGRPVEL